jgi:hypothetical protein
VDKIDSLKKIEMDCQRSLYHWGIETDKYYPEKIMNWSRCVRSMFTAQQLWDDEKYGEALGLLNSWNPVFKTFISSSNTTDLISNCLENITSSAVKIREGYDDWNLRNQTVYFEEIKKYELSNVELN